MDGRFAALEEMMKKMLEDKQKMTTSKTTVNHGRGGNPNPFRGRENSEVEVLEGEDGMPPLEPLSREEMSQAYDRRGADFDQIFDIEGTLQLESLLARKRKLAHQLTMQDDDVYMDEGH
ncbi:hypothetical protein M5K25_019710 [Dendrobium thyrsiflorum]|uniref:Uncharacterized protein n=1 Tax=Dendrobium thyrsiflorum TaxID=117978 RepID=A0ABD0UMI9_DENTH